MTTTGTMVSTSTAALAGQVSLAAAMAKLKGYDSQRGGVAERAIVVELWMGDSASTRGELQPLGYGAMSLTVLTQLAKLIPGAHRNAGVLADIGMCYAVSWQMEQRLKALPTKKPLGPSRPSSEVQ